MTGGMLSGTPAIERMLGVPSALLLAFGPARLMDGLAATPGGEALLGLVDIVVDIAS